MACSMRIALAAALVVAVAAAPPGAAVTPLPIGRAFLAKRIVEPSAPEPPELIVEPPEMIVEPTAPAPEFPKTWGSPPEEVTEDWVPLAGGYGHGSSTTSAWILRNIRRDLEVNTVRYPPAFGKPPEMVTEDWVPLPFGYGRGSSTIAKWLADGAAQVYQEEWDDEANEIVEPSAPEPPELIVEPSAPEPPELIVEPPEMIVEPMAPAPEFPKSWGSPPDEVTEDWVPLAGGYGHGSSTTSAWILRNIRRDLELNTVCYPPAFGKPPEMVTEDWVPLPFGYGKGSSTIAKWLADGAAQVYQEEWDDEAKDQVIEQHDANLRHEESEGKALPCSTYEIIDSPWYKAFGSRAPALARHAYPLLAGQLRSFLGMLSSSRLAVHV